MDEQLFQLRVEAQKFIKAAEKLETLMDETLRKHYVEFKKAQLEFENLMINHRAVILGQAFGVMPSDVLAKLEFESQIVLGQNLDFSKILQLRSVETPDFSSLENLKEAFKTIKVKDVVNEPSKYFSKSTRNYKRY
ncbi:hypothetical protein [uncultured Flavobacterium sp.]|uniref:hypothetical protein n=1 Tax=uncultured Flavobacterium sp. TaxID=165435 RepID=UPI0025F7E12C|nr:hypothetical protein [uncultured Flavobacterium sp.]